MRYLSLFSGIGMHDLGFERAGWQCAGQVEIDPFCRAVLEKHWPYVPRWADVRDVQANDIVERCGRIELITGGFPCQPHSLAGRRLGLADERHLWPVYFELIKGIQPDWVVGENVTGIRDTAADLVISDLESTGYSVWPLVLASSTTGLPFHRERVWFLARANSCEPVPSWTPVDSTRRDMGDNRLPGEKMGRVSSRRSVSRPFEQLREWEHPRVNKSVLDVRNGGDAARLDRFADEQTERALGNGNPPQVAELIARTINATAAALREAVAPC